MNGATSCAGNAEPVRRRRCETSSWWTAVSVPAAGAALTARNRGASRSAFSFPVCLSASALAGYLWPRWLELAGHGC